MNEQKNNEEEEDQYIAIRKVITVIELRGQTCAIEIQRRVI